MKAFLGEIKNIVGLVGGFGIRQGAAVGAVRSCPHTSEVQLSAAMGRVAHCDHKTF